MHKKFIDIFDNKLVKTFLSVFIIIVLSVTPVLADDVDSLKNDKNKAEKELESLENDMAYLLQLIDELELKMAYKAAEIDEVNQQLAEAEEEQAKQYEDMKLRIKYMYEDQSTSIVEVLLSAEDMSTMLNKAEYMQEVYNYDRNKLSDMAETANEIKELKEKLDKDQETLELTQNELTEKQSLLYTTITEKKETISDLDSKIEEAARKAAEAALANRYNQASSYVPMGNQDSEVANAIVSMAYSLLGVPYRSGGASPSGFDCSGFTSYLFAQQGIGISRSSSAQAYGGRSVDSLSEAMPGDIICYPGHVGLYVGGGMMIHANVPGGSVRLVGVNSIGMRIIAIRRYW